MSSSTHIDVVNDGETEVLVRLPNVVLRVIDDLATRKGITRTEALVESVVTAAQALVDISPHGAAVTPMTIGQRVLHTHDLRV